LSAQSEKEIQKTLSNFDLIFKEQDKDADADKEVVLEHNHLPADVVNQSETTFSNSDHYGPPPTRDQAQKM